MARSDYKKAFEEHIFNAIETVFNEAHLFPLIDSLYAKIESAIAQDPQFLGTENSSYGYGIADWKKSIVQGLGDHNTYGIKPYISDRVKSAKEQFVFAHSTESIRSTNARIFPNPGNDAVTLTFDSPVSEKISIRNLQGQVLKTLFLISGETFNASDLASGCYFIQVGNRPPLQWIKTP